MVSRKNVRDGYLVVLFLAFASGIFVAGGYTGIASLFLGLLVGHTLRMLYDNRDTR